jgi:hypothetical protein
MSNYDFADDEYAGLAEAYEEAMAENKKKLETDYADKTESTLSEEEVIKIACKYERIAAHVYPKEIFAFVAEVRRAALAKVMPAPKQEPYAFEYQVEIDGGLVPRILKANSFGLNKTVYDFDLKNIKPLYDHPPPPQTVAIPEGYVHVDEVIQLCKDFSTIRGDVYIGDVEAALSGLAAPKPEEE